MINRAIDGAAAFTDMLKKLEEVPQRQLGPSTDHRAAEMAVAAGYETRTQRRARERREAKEARRQAKQEAK